MNRMKTKTILSIAVFSLLAQSAVGEADLTKAVVISLEFMEGNLQQQGIIIVYNYPPDYRIPLTEGLRIEIRSANGELLDSFFRPDPRNVFISGFGYIYEENARFDLILGFIDGMRTVEISDDDGKLISIDLTPAMGEFCSEENDICDPECAGFADPDCESATTTAKLGTTTTVKSPSTSEGNSLGSILGYLPYLLIIIIAIAIILRLRKRQQIAESERKKKKEEEDLRIWAEEQLRNGEDPALLKKALEKQGADPAVVDEFMRRV